MAQKSRTALKTSRDTNFADNTTGAISPQKLRDFLDDFIDSDFNLSDDNIYTDLTATKSFEVAIGNLAASGLKYADFYVSAGQSGFIHYDTTHTQTYAVTIDMDFGLLISDTRTTKYGILYNSAGYVNSDRSLTDRGYVLGICNRTLFDDYADAGNVTTGETDIYSHTLVASQLAANGDKITAEYAGIFVSSATATRQVKIKFAGTTLLDTGALATVASDIWKLKASIVRVSSTVIRYNIDFTYSTLSTGVNLGSFLEVGELTGLTLSNTNILKLTGTAASAGAATNDIVAKMGTIIFKPHA